MHFGGDFLNIQSVYKKVSGAQRNRLRLKMKIFLYPFASIWCLPTSDQFNIIMLDNMYVKHKPSSLGPKILINGTLREIDITLKI